MELVQAWDMFRTLYLLPTEPGFFYHHFAPSPPFHYQALYDLGQYARNILVAPRGFAKSYVVGTEVPLFLLLTRPHFRIVLSLATDNMIESRFDTIIRQLTENPFILEDFGFLKPKRGQAVWNRHHIRLLNGAKMEGFSITGRKRGARPDLFLLDDPEYDPESDSSSSAILLKEKFETFLFRQVLPMLEKGSSIFWVGTMIGRRSFLYHSCFGRDPRFRFWNRQVYSSVLKEIGEEGESNLLWESKYDEEFLDNKREEMGNAAFEAEYQNNPTSDQDRVLVIHPTKNEYKAEEHLGTHPLESTAPIITCKYNKVTKRWEPVAVPANELLAKMFRVLTFDPAEGLSQHHDYSSIAVTGFDTDNCLWVLDLWLGRAKDLFLLNKIYSMGLKWQPRVLGIESTSTQIQIVDSMSTLLEERKESGWYPRLVPVDYQKVKGDKSKAGRIATLEWRFDSGKIKYPSHLSDTWPFSMLYSQTRDFTYDMALLPFDDALDSVAMTSFVIHGRGAQTQQVVQQKSLVERLQGGETSIAGVPIISGLDPNQLTSDSVVSYMERDKILRARDERAQDPLRKRQREFRIKRPRTERMRIGRML